jgi:choline dehydrogenase-like flavoprotein
MNIIDTGGTAGNVVAGRLAENPKVSVLVIEAGAGYVLTLLTSIPFEQLAD